MDLIVPIAANLLLGALLLGLFLVTRTRDQVTLADGNDALRVFREQFPGTDGTATLAADRRGALIALQHGNGVGIVQRRGRKWTARAFAPSDLRAAVPTGRDSLTLAFRDFGWPKANIQIPDPDVRADWLRRLQGISETDGDSIRRHS